MAMLGSDAKRKLPERKWPRQFGEIEFVMRRWRNNS
jgi:hypothetical protein